MPLQKESAGKRRSFGSRFQQQGAPADFPGVVIPNPDHITPQKDTDPPPVKTRLSYGARFSTKNFAGKPTGDTSNGKQLWPDIQKREQ
jgi:hypothetical protein